MTQTFDCIVLGVGGFGSGALYHLARRGVRVLGIERFGVAHDRGSSHGETRIIRQAYFEHPDYVPLLLEAYRLWSELEQESARSLLHVSGLLLAGPPDGEAVSGAQQSARLYGVGLEDVSLADARRRYSGFRFPDEMAVVFEPSAGYLEVEHCVRTHIECAVARGAELHTDEVVRAWSSDGQSVRVRTDRGEYSAGSLVITAGPWASEVLRELAIPLVVVRKPLFWHEVAGRQYDASAGAPAYIFETRAGVFYGFPSIDGATVKVAEHTQGEAVTDPLEVDRDVHESDRAPVDNFLREFMPGVRPRAVRHCVCMYTRTPDLHFIVDAHPQLRNVAIGAGFSGHGFKFTSVLGRALAEVAIDGRTELPIGFLSVGREALVR